MNLWPDLFAPRGFLFPALLAGLAFAGHGVSHAAFGGFGLAVALGMTGSAQTLGFLLVLGGSCVAAALAVALITRRGGAVREDSATGIVLVTAMAAGSILIALAARRGDAGRIPSWESFLFGELVAVGPTYAAVAWAFVPVIFVGLWAGRRPLLLWAHDEQAALAAGYSASLVRAALLVMLAVAIVVSIRLAGVVLATALLILPAATALRLGRRLGVVLALSVVVAVAGVVGGLVVSVRQGDLPPGPCIVMVLFVLYAMSAAAGSVRGGGGR